MSESENLGKVLKAHSRMLLRKNAPKPFVVGLVFVALLTIISEMQFHMPKISSAYNVYMEQISAGMPHSLDRFLSYLNPLGIAFIPVLWLLTAIFNTGLKSYCMNTVREQRASYFDLLDGLLFFGKVILIRLISSVFILLWSLLFIIPGLMAFYRYRQAYYILIDDPKKSAMQCIRESSRLMLDRKLDLLFVDFSFCGLLLLSVAITSLSLLFLPFALPLAAIWLSVYMGFCHAMFYDRLIKTVTA